MKIVYINGAYQRSNSDPFGHSQVDYILSRERAMSSQLNMLSDTTVIRKFKVECHLLHFMLMQQHIVLLLWFTWFFTHHYSVNLSLTECSGKCFLFEFLAQEGSLSSGYPTLSHHLSEVASTIVVSMSVSRLVLITLKCN